MSCTGPTVNLDSSPRSQAGMKVNDSAWVAAMRRVFEFASLKALASPGILAALASMSRAMRSNHLPVSVSVAG